MGNQLFQYANAFAVARRNDSELILDIRDAQKDYDSTEYPLIHFGISKRVAEFHELPPHRRDKVPYLIWRNFGRNPKFIRENELAFNSQILSLGSGCYLYGYFQSERYFKDCEQIIRHELQIITPPSGKNGELLKRLSGENAVSLHVRRGDYLSKDNLSTFARCSGDYYNAAVAYVAERVDPIVIYVFTDDPEWVRNNLNFNHPMIISDQNQGELAYEDLRLMLACRHNIIANSSFSWWGAWLNPNPNKIVVAPEKWFADGHPDNPDIIPPQWHRMAN